VGLDNLVDFISTCVTHPMAANQTFMVSDGFDVSTSELVRTMARTIGVADRQFSVPVPVLKLIGNLTGKAAVMERLCGNLQLDITKARTLLDWTPRVSFEEGIRKTMLGIS
jgi:nucleoside-diphosphate-sugar epimerase